MGGRSGTNWLLVEGRLCYLQAGVSDRSGGWRGRGPDLSRLFSDSSHPILEPPDPPIDSIPASRIQMPSYFCKLSEMCCSMCPTIKVCEDTRGMPRMFVTLSSDCVLCWHSLSLGCCHCAFCELGLGGTSAHSEDIRLNCITSRYTLLPDCCRCAFCELLLRGASTDIEDITCCDY